ncbi:MAG: hypothetical protein JSV40_11130 [Deltaproteobacteria bacterium]|nr:MAG: hypothetical protein JSV40_11130 [Deltaproteobacteria bacterium]
MIKKHPKRGMAMKVVFVKWSSHPLKSLKYPDDSAGGPVSVSLTNGTPIRNNPQ